VAAGPSGRAREVRLSVWHGGAWKYFVEPGMLSSSTYGPAAGTVCLALVHHQLRSAICMWHRIVGAGLAVWLPRPGDCTACWVCDARSTRARDEW
jgi:hypothetical protein